MTDLAEQIARALAPYLEGGREFDQMPNNKEAKRAWHRANMCSINDATKEDALDAARAVLPFIAAERERCAGIADTLGGDRVERDQDGQPRAYDMSNNHGRGDAILNAQRVRAQSIAAAIRSQP